MAAILMLECKATGEMITGKDLISVDERMCKHFGVKPDKVNWFENWMDTVGFNLAVGQTDPECLRGYWNDTTLFKIWEWITGEYHNRSNGVKAA